MDGWINGLKGGWMSEQTDRQIDGRKVYYLKVGPSRKINTGFSPVVALVTVSRPHHGWFSRLCFLVDVEGVHVLAEHVIPERETLGFTEWYG